MASYFGYQSYRSAVIRKEVSLAKELISIVRTASVQLDVTSHEDVFFDPDDGLEGRTEFDMIQKVLAAIRDANNLSHDNGSPVYTLRKSYDFEENQQVEFVVMSDVNDNGNFYTGARIKAEPIHLQAFLGESAVTGVYRDSEGEWISAVAPLFLDGEVVGIIQADRTVGFFFHELAEIKKNFFVIGAICVLIGTIFSFLFAVYAAKPLNILLAAIKAFGNGNYDFRITKHRIDDFDDVFSGFNDMADNIQREHRENIIIDEERSKLNGKLTKSLQDIEKSLAVKNEFLANMSHEIRTPMNSIVGFTRILSDSQLSKRQHMLLKRVDGSSRNLMRIVNQILDQSKIEAGKLELDIAEYDLRQEMVDLIMMNAEAAKERRINLLLIVLKPLPKNLSGDGMRTSQILLNLLNNSVKFTQKGYVSITVDWKEIEGRRVELTFVVKDTGIGIGSQAKDEIFNPFTQANTSISKSYGGTGLGLSIARNIAELMEGKVEFESDVGIGSTFSVIVIQRVPDTVTIPTKQECNETARFDYVNSIGAKYLLIETCVPVIEQFTMWFGKEHVDSCANMSDYENILKEGSEVFTLDYIVVDDYLGRHNIGEVRSLANKHGFPGAKIVAMTAIDDVCESRLDWADYVITKPLILDEVVTSLKHVHERVSEKSGEKTRSIIERGTQPETSLPFKRKTHVLLVEDNADNELLATMLLDECGVSYVVANDGAEAIYELHKGRLANANFDLVLMDLQMPVMDGITATKKIKADARISSVPIVAMTANATAADKQQCMDVGMTAILLKPIDETEFSQLLDSYLVTPTVSHLLLVDDDDSNRMLMGILLEKYGVTYDAANNGEEAVEKAKQRKYDLILMDVVMPVMDGLAATKLVISDGKNQHTPIIAMTGYSDKNKLKACSDAGMVDYVGKPVQANLLYKALDRYLSSTNQQ